MGHDLVAGDLFIFVSRNRRLLKLLVWDGTGLVQYNKRLGRGRFAELWRGRDGEQVELSRRAMAQLLEGIDITRAAGFRPTGSMVKTV